VIRDRASLDDVRLCLPCRAGNDMHCQASLSWHLHDGGFAELLRTNARAVVPWALDWRPRTCSLADAGLTAYHAAKKSIPCWIQVLVRW